MGIAGTGVIEAAAATAPWPPGDSDKRCGCWDSLSDPTRISSQSPALIIPKDLSCATLLAKP